MRLAEHKKAYVRERAWRLILLAIMLRLEVKQLAILAYWEQVKKARHSFVNIACLYNFTRAYP
jgi:hypothetical protein